MSPPPASKHYSLDPLSDGVYAVIARDGGAAIGNAGLVDLGDATLVIDTFLTPTAAEELRAEAQRLTGRNPRWVVNTHYHNDHIWGNQVFSLEADIISTVETRVLIQTAGQQEYDDYRAVTDDRLKTMLAQKAAAKTEAERATADLMLGYFSGLSHDFPRLQVTPPNLVFEKRMVLYGSKRRAELVTFEGAHTGSDTVVYLPDDGVLFMADLLFVGLHPYVADGNPDRWLEVLRSILDGTAGIQNAKRFVPGHGPVGAPADLERLADYIKESQKIARALASDGNGSKPDVASTPIPAAFANWKLPHFFYANLGFLVEQYRNNGGEAGSMQSKKISNSSRF